MNNSSYSLLVKRVPIKTYILNKSIHNLDKQTPKQKGRTFSTSPLYADFETILNLIHSYNISRYIFRKSMKMEKAYIQIFNEFDPIWKWWKGRCPLFMYQILLTLWISTQRKLSWFKDKIIYTSWDMTLQKKSISVILNGGNFFQYTISKCDFFPSSYCL